MTDDEYDELVAVIEDSIFSTSTGLDAAVESANRLRDRGWRGPEERVLGNE